MEKVARLMNFSAFNEAQDASSDLVKDVKPEASEEAPKTLSEQEDKYESIKNELKKMLKESEGGYEEILSKVDKNITVETLNIKGFVSESDIRDFYLAHQFAINEKLNEIDFFDDKLSSFGINTLDSVITIGAQIAVQGILNDIKENLNFISFNENKRFNEYPFDKKTGIFESFKKDLLYKIELEFVYTSYVDDEANAYDFFLKNKNSLHTQQEFLNMLKRHNVTAKIIEFDCGGGWPLIEFTGTKKEILSLLNDTYSENEDYFNYHAKPLPPVLQNKKLKKVNDKTGLYESKI
jgi:hypothetical protein